MIWSALTISCLQGRTVQWRPPRYNTVHRLLTNPVYAEAYVFGRTISRVRFEGGRKVITHGVMRRREDWEVLIRDHHDGTSHGSSMNATRTLSPATPI